MSAIEKLSLSEAVAFHRQTGLSLIDFNQMLPYPLYRSCLDVFRVMPPDQVEEALADGVKTDGGADTQIVGDYLVGLLKNAQMRVQKSGGDQHDMVEVRDKAASILETEIMRWDWEDYMRGVGAIVWLFRRREDSDLTYDDYADSATPAEAQAEFAALNLPDTPADTTAPDPEPEGGVPLE